MTVFKKTDAQTFILTLRHKVGLTKTVNLSHIHEPLTLDIDNLSAIERADYSFYKKTKDLVDSNYVSDTEFGIFRGNRSHNDLVSSLDNHVHTN